MHPGKQLMSWETNLFDRRKRDLLCATLHAPGKHNHGFVSSKPNTPTKYKILVTEIIQDSTDHLTAQH
jgi:hypothetical protein